MKDIREISEILDESISKAEKISESKAKLRKGLSFDPFTPHTMGMDSPFYNPYQAMPDGSFAPHPYEYLRQEKGVSAESTDYNTVRHFYEAAEGFQERHRPVVQAEKNFSRFAKSIPDLIKAGPVPIGTVHTYADGQRYKKVAEGRWEPVKAGPGHNLGHADAKRRSKAAQEIEGHAGKVSAITNALKKKKGEKDLVNRTRKDVLRHMREMVPSLFDGPMPDGLKQKFDLRRKTPGTDKPKQKLEKHEEAEKKVKEAKKKLDRITNSADENPSPQKEKKRAEALKEFLTANKEFEQSIKERIEGLKGEPKPVKKKTEKVAEKTVGTPADEKRILNGLDVPPEKNKPYVVPGAQTTIKDVANFIQEFEGDFKALESLANDIKASGATHYSARLKDQESLYNKMKGRLKDRSLNSVTDVIGSRALATSIKDQKSILKKIQSTMKIEQVDDSTDKARPDGYRAIHLLFRTPSGKLGELQIKTHRQQVFSGFTHDAIYKGSPEIKNNPEVQKFSQAVSDYLYNQDIGKDPGERPVEPKILQEQKLYFPWDEVDQIQDIKKGDGLKYYVVIRDRQKKNQDIQEFNSLKEAKSFSEKKRSEGHKGELPIAHAHSKAEMLKVFSEYRPQGPGSRGGKVVGYTKAGKPKYQKK